MSCEQGEGFSYQLRVCDMFSIYKSRLDLQIIMPVMFLSRGKVQNPIKTSICNNSFTLRGKKVFKLSSTEFENLSASIVSS